MEGAPVQWMGNVVAEVKDSAVFGSSLGGLEMNRNKKGDDEGKRLLERRKKGHILKELL